MKTGKSRIYCSDTESIPSAPKSPDKDCMKMLIRANQFIEHAKLHAHSGQEFDLMIAIHNLDIDIKEVYGDRSCIYALSDREARLFYVDSYKSVAQLQDVVKHGYGWSNFKRYIGDNLNHSSRELIKIFGMDAHVVMNDPETWEVYISYQTIPFTRQIIYDSDSLNDEEPVDLNKDLDKLSCGNEIQTFLPLESLEDATRLEKYCIDNEIDSCGWFSSRLIDKVTDK